jgi:hypothetical protein
VKTKGFILAIFIAISIIVFLVTHCPLPHLYGTHTSGYAIDS